jgi:hypothetical protein
VTALTGDEMRDQLGNGALVALLHLRTEKGPYSGEAALEVADALLPVVRKIAADELRAAAGGVPRFSPAAIAKWLRDRADVLDPS